MTPRNIIVTGQCLSDIRKATKDVFLILVVVGNETLSTPVASGSAHIICGDYERLHDITNRAWFQLSQLNATFERELLLKHHEYLSQYLVIIGYVLADERRSNVTPTFTQEMRESRRLLSLTIVELEDVMIKTGISPIEIGALSVTNTPSFCPEQQENSDVRHKRDQYTLNDLTKHLRKAYGDFEYLQRKIYRRTAPGDLEVEDCDE